MWKFRRMDTSLKYNIKFIKIRQMYELFEKGFPKF